ncbi:MAG: argininosuccinate synthase [Salinivirgaceae bacterium]|nr:argininosuccinate synthase [Salinivirgaceae bacterium]
MSGSKKTVVLAYSGGLDTTYTAKYLSVEKGMDVITVVGNTGGFSEEQLADIEAKAKELGSVKHVVLNVEKEYYNSCIKYLVYGNVLKNNTYPLSVSSERFFQAKAIAEYANEINADYLSHGCTGAGNDQVRFDLVWKLIAPNKEIISLVRDESLSREDEINYLRKYGVNSDFTKMEYSINEGLWGTSIGGKETLTSNKALPISAYPSQPTKTETEKLEIEFTKGQVTMVNGKSFEHAVDAIRYINEIGNAFAVGRGIHTGDTIIGTKGRVGFEAAAAYLIIKAHHELEKHTLTKAQMQWKEQLGSWYGTMLHDSLYLEPAMRNVENFLDDTQKHVTGQVTMILNPYYYMIEGVTSKFDLMNSSFGSYGEMAGKWSADDVKGFVNIMSNSLRNYYSVNEDEI